MNQKELGELRKLFRPDQNAISRIYGCYVNSAREVVAYMDQSLGYMPQEEVEQYLTLFKKVLSGKQGKNLIDIEFSVQQVENSDEHRLLSSLRNSGLKDEETLREFYRKIIDSLDMGENNYLILLAYDVYDVPYKSSDDNIFEEASEEVFSYIICSICPVKSSRLELGYFPNEQEFHNYTVGQLVSPPELGFLFPAFDDRTANIYNALFYSRKASELHQEFIDAVFNTEPPMSAPEQKEAFETALSEALEDMCRMEIVQSVNERLREKIDQHKESKDPEMLVMTSGELGGILGSCGVPDERITVFQEKCDEQFGEDAVLNPSNLIDSNRFEVKTSEVTISVDPEHSYLVETRVIDGRKYIMIPAGEGVEVNGLAVGIGEEETT